MLPIYAVAVSQATAGTRGMGTIQLAGAASRSCRERHSLRRTGWAVVYNLATRVEMSFPTTAVPAFVEYASKKRTLVQVKHDTMLFAVHQRPRTRLVYFCVLPPVRSSLSSFVRQYSAGGRVPFAQQISVSMQLLKTLIHSMPCAAARRYLRPYDPMLHKRKGLEGTWEHSALPPNALSSARSTPMQPELSSSPTRLAPRRRLILAATLKKQIHDNDKRLSYVLYSARQRCCTAADAVQRSSDRVTQSPRGLGRLDCNADGTRQHGRLEDGLARFSHLAVVSGDQRGPAASAKAGDRSSLAHVQRGPKMCLRAMVGLLAGLVRRCVHDDGPTRALCRLRWVSEAGHLVQSFTAHRWRVQALFSAVSSSACLTSEDRPWLERRPMPERAICRLCLCTERRDCQHCARPAALQQEQQHAATCHQSFQQHSTPASGLLDTIANLGAWALWPDA